MLPRLLTSVLLFATCILHAQPDQTVPPFPEVHVDQRCRIFAADRVGDDQRFSKPHWRSDPGVCRIQGKHETKHWEERVEDGVVQRTRVEIHEQTYLLFNGTSMPVTFVVDQSLPHGWRIDSTPQPVEVADSMATFRVVAYPGQTLKLHVGERH